MSRNGRLVAALLAALVAAMFYVGLSGGQAGADGYSALARVAASGSEVPVEVAPGYSSGGIGHVLGTSKLTGHQFMFSEGSKGICVLGRPTAAGKPFDFCGPRDMDIRAHMYLGQGRIATIQGSPSGVSTTPSPGAGAGASEPLIASEVIGPGLVVIVHNGQLAG